MEREKPRERERGEIKPTERKDEKGGGGKKDLLIRNKEWKLERKRKMQKKRGERGMRGETNERREGLRNNRKEETEVKALRREGRKKKQTAGWRYEG